jgi:hypothetical protein
VPEKPFEPTERDFFPIDTTRLHPLAVTDSTSALTLLNAVIDWLDYRTDLNRYEELALDKLKGAKQWLMVRERGRGR